MRLAAALALLLAAACVPPAPIVERGPPVPQVSLQQVRLAYYRGGELVASGTADALTYQRTTSEFAATQVALHLPGRGGSLSKDLDLSAPLAKGTMAARQADGEDGVVVQTPSGLVGRTSRVHFDGVASTASGTDEVLVEGPRYQLTSRGFTLDLASERFTFVNGVHSRFGGEP